MEPQQESRSADAGVAAVHSRRNNRLWSSLSAVGIIVGAAAVGALLTNGYGWTRGIQDEADNLSNQINIAPAKGIIPDPTGVAPQNLTDSDVNALRDKSRAPHVTEVSPLMSGTVTVTAGQAKAKVNMVGVEQDYSRLLDRYLVAGRWFTPAQITGAERAVILGPQAANLLFGQNTDPGVIIGRPIQILRSTFTIVGVFGSNGQADNLAAVPFLAARAYLTGDNSGQVDNIVVKSTSTATMPDAVSEIVAILDAQHHIHTAADRDYNVNTYTDSIKKSEDFIYYLRIFVIAIAAISLSLGAVGVAKIWPRSPKHGSDRKVADHGR